MSLPCPEEVKKGLSQRFDSLLEIADKSGIYVAQAELTERMDAIYYGLGEDKFIILDMQRLKNNCKFEDILAVMLSCINELGPESQVSDSLDPIRFYHKAS
jgi:hypothetical protein